MKKITALLLSCMMIGCTFASCGSDSDSDSEKSTKSTTTASTEASTDDDEASTEASTSDEETSTEEKTTEDEDIPNGEGGNLETNVLGKWQIEKMSMGGEDMTEFFGVPFSALLHLEIKYDGTIEASSPLDEEEQIIKGTWTVSGLNKIKLNVEKAEESEDMTMLEDDSEFEYEDGKLVAKEDDETSGMSTAVYLIKVDEFEEIDLDKLQQELESQFGGMFSDDDEEEDDADGVQ